MTEGLNRIGRRAVLGVLAAGAGLACADAQAQQQQPPGTPPSPQLPPRFLPPEWGKAPTLALWPKGAPGAAEYRAAVLPARFPPFFLRNTQSPDLHVFPPKQSNGRALLVIPGGGYEFVSVDNEGVDVAAKFCPLGYTVFVLNYRLPGEGWRQRANVPLQDAQRAVRVIRAEAARYKIDPDRIGVIGFSAGGHLAASLATGFAEKVYDASDNVDQLSAKPGATALIYPVITMTEQYTHAGSRKFLLGEAPSDELVALRSAEMRVTADTTPLFLVHACDDEAVPVENSLMMLAAARAAKRPVEAHLLQEGRHAFGVGRSGTPSSEWIPLLHLWLQRTFIA